MATKFLTEQQLARFHAFGFLAFPGLLADRIDEVTARHERARSGDHDYIFGLGRMDGGLTRRLPDFDRRRRRAVAYERARSEGLAGLHCRFGGPDRGFHLIARGKACGFSGAARC